MKIPNELIPVAYDLSKKVFEGTLTLKEGQAQLVGDDRMNPNSAADFIHNFRYMMEGKKFARTNSAYSADYFLENIYNDYGAAQLANALKAVRLHIDYYEKLQNTTMHTMRAICDKYASILLEIS